MRAFVYSIRGGSYGGVTVKLVDGNADAIDVALVFTSKHSMCEFFGTNDPRDVDGAAVEISRVDPEQMVNGH